MLTSPVLELDDIKMEFHLGPDDPPNQSIWRFSQETACQYHRHSTHINDQPWRPFLIAIKSSFLLKWFWRLSNEKPEPITFRHFSSCLCGEDPSSWRLMLNAGFLGAGIRNLDAASLMFFGHIYSVLTHRSHSLRNRLCPFCTEIPCVISRFSSTHFGMGSWSSSWRISCATLCLGCRTAIQVRWQ